MDMLNKSILDICKDFIEVADKLYQNEQITYEEYIEMTELKFDYIKRMT